MIIINVLISNIAAFFNAKDFVSQNNLEFTEIKNNSKNFFQCFKNDFFKALVQLTVLRVVVFFVIQLLDLVSPGPQP